MKRKLTYILLCFVLLLPIVAVSQNKPVIVKPPKKELPKPNPPKKQEQQKKKKKKKKTNTNWPQNAGIEAKPPKPEPPKKPEPIITSNYGNSGNSATNNRFSQNGNFFTVYGVSFEMIPVSGGSFMMGSDDSNAYDNEKPVHREYVSDFKIGKTEVTQALWKAVMGSNPSKWKGDNLPVESVSWDDCQEFIRKLNSITGQNFRLPSEPEWEYAARGGNRSNCYKYSGSNDPGIVAWYEVNSDSRTHNVSTKRANELGIYDMSGNVREWTQSLWCDSYSSSSSGSDRVCRGGSWFNVAGGCRVSIRFINGPSIRRSGLGLRLAL